MAVAQAAVAALFGPLAQKLPYAADATVKKKKKKGQTDKNKYWQGRGEIGTCIHYQLECEVVQPF